MQRNIKPRAIALAVSSLFMLAASQVAMADSADDLLKKLKEKGILTEQEYDEFNATRDTEKVKKNSEIKASFKDGIIWESGDKSTSFQVSGRIHADYRSFARPVPENAATTAVATAANESNTFDIRRARIELKGKFYDSYDFLVSTDLAGTSAGNTTSILDQAYFNINWWKEVQFRFGQFKMPMNLEKVTSSNFVDFQERSVVNQLAPNEDRGAMVWGLPYDGITYALAISNGEGAKNRNDTDPRVDDIEFVGRGTVNFAEIFADKSHEVMHVGVSGSHTTLNKPGVGAATATGLLSGANAVRTEPRGINFLTLPTFSTAVNNIDTGIDRTRYGVEGAFAYGPVKIQGEWLRNKFDWEGGAAAATSTSHSADLDAWYVEALWLVTGENYASAYKDGAFGIIKPKNEFVHPSVAFSNNAWGAWEVGARYSKLDASDFAAFTTTTGAASAANGLATTINAGGATSVSTLEASTWTVGVKWIPVSNARIMLNYVRTDFDTPIFLAGALHKNENAVTVRTQWNF